MSVLKLILTSVVLSVFGQIFMKKGMTNVGAISLRDLIGKRLFSVLFEKFVILGIVLYVTSAVFWLVVLSQAELSYAYPLVGVSYVFTAILSKIFFKESLTKFRMFGIILIAAGAYFLVATY